MKLKHTEMDRNKVLEDPLEHNAAQVAHLVVEIFNRLRLDVSVEAFTAGVLSVLLNIAVQKECTDWMADALRSYAGIVGTPEEVALMERAHAGIGADQVS